MVKQLLKKHVWDHWAAVHAMRDEGDGTLSSQKPLVSISKGVPTSISMEAFLVWFMLSRLRAGSLPYHRASTRGKD